MKLSEQLLESVLAIAHEAGAQLAHWYAQSVNVQHKADNTPVTEADLAISQFLSEKLTALTPEIPVLSEENCAIPFAERQHWARYWLIDPLDGTQQFIDRTGQFAVLITLVESNRPVLGVIHAPILQRTYYAMKGFGAFRQTPESHEKLVARPLDLSKPLKIALGASDNQQKVRSILAQNLDYDWLILGSSSLKSALVAEGSADCYVRLGKTGEWDTAAAEILLEEVNGAVFDDRFQPLTYNLRESLINPRFVMVADKQINWENIFDFKAL